MSDLHPIHRVRRLDVAAQVQALHQAFEAVAGVFDEHNTAAVLLQPVPAEAEVAHGRMVFLFWKFLIFFSTFILLFN